MSYDTNGIYTQFFDAIAEVKSRWDNPELKKAVEESLGGDIPDAFQQGPKATLVRYVASPNLEFYYFSDLAQLSTLDPVYLEYAEDKFVARNPSKYYLAKLTPCHNKNFFSSLRNKDVKVVDFNVNEGKLLTEVKTLNGKNLTDFHHDLFKVVKDEIQKPVIFDFSAWFKKHRKRTELYYFDYLSLFVCHGVLFENFLGNSKMESEFTKNIVIPAFKKVESVFGVKPLIVPLQPFKAEEEHSWYGYKDSILQAAKKMLEK